VSALIGGSLQFKPILALTGGKVEFHSKARTFKKALVNKKSIVIDKYPPNRDGHTSIMHADNRSLAEDLSSYFMGRLSILQSQISYLPLAIISYAGPGSIAAGFLI